MLGGEQKDLRTLGHDLEGELGVRALVRDERTEVPDRPTVLLALLLEFAGPKLQMGERLQA